MRGLIAIAVLMAVFVAHAALAEVAGTYIIIESPLRAFIYRAYNLFRYARNAVIVLSVFYFITFAWRAFAGDRQASIESFFPMVVLLLVLGVAELVMAWFLTSDVSMDENMERVMGDIRVPVPEGRVPIIVQAREVQRTPVAAPAVPAPAVPAPPGAPAIIGRYQMPAGWRLGGLAERFETAGRGPGVVNTHGRVSGGYYRWTPGDPGGCSFGVYQIATLRHNNMVEFLNFIRSRDPSIHGRLVRATGASAARACRASFVNEWRAIARERPEQFRELQRLYIEHSLFRPAITRARNNNPQHAQLLANPLVQDIMWSAAVQHGSAGSNRILTATLRAGGGRDVETFVRTFYAERRAFVRGIRFSGDARQQAAMVQSLVTRFNNEERDALALLGRMRRL